MKKRIVALLLCCVMLLTLSPSLIATATAEDETSGAAQQVEQTGETKDTDPQPEQQPDQAKDGDKNEPQPTEEPKQDTAPVEEDGADADEPAPAPAVVPVVEQNVPVTSEIVYPTVNFTDVAPFLDPVSGSSMRRAARNVATQDAKDDGISMSKTATANQDGSYTITLEAYATGSKVISEITKDVPTDIILVLDQSGSMAEDIGTVSFEQYKDESEWWGGTTYHTRNQDYYEYRHNDGSANLWHKLADDSYVSVSVTRQENPNYTAITNGKNNSTSGGATSYWSNRNNLYAMVDGKYLKVTVNCTSSYGTYTYTLPDGTQIASQKGANKSPTFTGIEGNVIYLAAVDDAATTYTYTYTDSNGNVQTIGTSIGAETAFSPALYERITSTSGGGTRLDALKIAVNNFASAVHTKSLGKDGQAGGGDDINHRIALVGFSSPDYNNTELLTGSAINQGDWKGTNISTGGWNGYYYFPTGYEMNGPQYGSISDAQYKAALLAMNTDAGLSGVASGVNALTAWGGTRTDNGLAMANKIFEQNPIPTGEQRNRVVIVFTDGIPGLSGYDGSVASSAITESNTAKTTYGATVYTIGIFSGADATSAGDSNGNDTQKANRFMQQVSSNNGTPRTPSYYLSAGDSASLNNIFQQISDQISTGGSDSQLTESAVVRDIISPQFTLPAGASAKNITLETYACTGVDENGAYTWSKNTDAMGATANVSGDQVDVTGFNYSGNWCGSVTEKGSTTYRGNKLVIKFTVQPKDGFLGGNDVITNGEKSGIYVNDQATNPLKPFEQPTVNVPIKDVTVTAANENVYLLGSVTADQLKNDATVEVGGVTLDLSKATDTNKPYGLDPWQTEYVDITVTVKDKDGKVISDKLDNLTDDTTYTVEVTVAPKTVGTSTAEKGDAATAKTSVNNPAANIYVFKPELTFKDSTAYYGDAAPTDFTGNKVGTEKWMHDGTEAVPGKMLGEKPTLDISYAPEANKIDDAGKINTKQDIEVSAKVEINGADVTNKTTFVHQDCNPVCGWNVTTPNGNPAFLIHVKTCQLTITKQGGDAGEPYVFTVKKDGQPYTEVTIVGNNNVTIYELPVGTYTIEENTGWSWRYSANNGGSAALTAQNPIGAITCTNTLKNNYWLNGFSDVVTNTFDVKHK